MSKNRLAKHKRRPKKSPAEKAKRQAVQRKRLVSLGVAEEQVAKMSPVAVREMLKYPAKIVPASEA